MLTLQGQCERTPSIMLTFGMFSFIVAAFLGCVWWACRDEEA